jgi:transposase
VSHQATSAEVLVIRLAAEGFSQRKICSTFGVGDHRVSRILREFHTEGIIPAPLRRGRPPKVTKAILDFIDIRTLQSAHLSSTKLTTEIEDKFHVSLSRRTIDLQRRLMHFRCQPPRHTQELKEHHTANRVEFCRHLLANPVWLGLIHFSDEPRFVIGDNKHWPWYRRGEENDSAMHPTEKVPPSLMIFGAIGPNYKSKVPFVEGRINAEKYIQKLTDLGIFEELDRLHGAFNWIFQQDGAPCHTSQMAVDCIEENCHLLSGWPANSPVLNPIALV